ncbi:MAG: hypothetical protein JWN02_2679 [Acidobacteria bacterium]|nr:hypothetical protein [Acidobacteriota bacterium]
MKKPCVQQPWRSRLCEHALARAEALESICLWRDEFFAKHFDIRTLAARVAHQRVRRSILRRGTLDVFGARWRA